MERAGYYKPADDVTKKVSLEVADICEMKPTAFLDLLMSMEDYFDGIPCLKGKRYILQRPKKDQLACGGITSKTNLMGPTSHQQMRGTK